MILNEVRPSVKSPSHSFNDDIIPYTSRARMFNLCGIRYLPRYLGRHTVNVERYVSGFLKHRALRSGVRLSYAILVYYIYCWKSADCQLLQ